MNYLTMSRNRFKTKTVKIVPPVSESEVLSYDHNICIVCGKLLSHLDFDDKCNDH